eukprot:716655-Pleurochrysis_carterae.AAC.1
MAEPLPRALLKEAVAGEEARPQEPQGRPRSRRTGPRCRRYAHAQAANANCKDQARNETQLLTQFLRSCA